MGKIKTTVALIGGGNMGGAILAGIAKNCRVCICEKDSRKRAQLTRRFKAKALSLEDCIRTSKVIVLAIKPQDMEDVLAAIRPVIGKKHLVVSIAAGITSAYIEERLGQGIRVVRTMPNMPAMVGKGITAVAGGRYSSSADVKTACRLLSSVGETVIVNESAIDAVTAVSGSGPAYVFLFAEYLMASARSLGLDEKLAERLVKSTLSGSAYLLEQSKEDAAALRARVTSKGGTTQAAMDVFAQMKTDEIFQKALAAAKNRARELSKG